VQIDDFGSGYSLLSLLQNLPLSTLKIDRSFLQALNDTPKSAAIIHTIIQLAHHLGMKAIAEGIENATQLQILKDLGCDSAQGYLFAKPLPLPELDVFMARALNPVPYSMAG
jgi:EAL domain-containing protein (putative c-di-GMP-specific phosphodiesterase class I)